MLAVRLEPLQQLGGHGVRDHDIRPVCKALPDTAIHKKGKRRVAGKTAESERTEDGIEMTAADPLRHVPEIAVAAKEIGDPQLLQLFADAAGEGEAALQRRSVAARINRKSFGNNQ